MKLTYIHQHFCLPNEPGGSRPYEFARRLADDGHDVTVIAGSDQPCDSRIEGFRLIRVKVPYANSMSYRQRILAFARFAVETSWRASRIPCDIVFASSTPLTVAVPAVAVRFVRRVPMVFEVRDLWPAIPIEVGALRNPCLIWMARLLELVAYRSSSCVIALSPWMEAGVTRRSPRTRTRMIPNASDFDLFSMAESERDELRRALKWSDKIVLAYAGSFGESYGLDWLVHLAKELGDEFRVVIYGEGRDSVRLRELAVELGLNAEDLLPGKVSKSEVARRIAACDGVISCLANVDSLQHNSLNKVFDGLAAGRPVFTNHGGWLSELVQEYGAGLKLSTDPREAAGQMEKLLQLNGLDSMGVAASKLGRDKFDREILYQDFVEVLTSSLRGKRRSPIT